MLISGHDTPSGTAVFRENGRRFPLSTRIQRKEKRFRKNNFLIHSSRFNGIFSNDFALSSNLYMKTI